MKSSNRKCIKSVFFIVGLLIFASCSNLQILNNKEDLEKYLKLNHKREVINEDLMIRIWYVNNRSLVHFMDELKISSNSSIFSHIEFGKKKKFPYLYLSNFKKITTHVLDEKEKLDIDRLITECGNITDSLQINSAANSNAIILDCLYISVEVYYHDKIFQSTCRYGYDCNKGITDLIAYLRLLWPRNHSILYY